jgi:tripartite-type tricarboxylate transporter receptor subunit TctC
MKILLTILFLLNTILLANTYPSKPITLVVGLGKGGSSDRMARNMAIFLEKELNTSINIINKEENASLEAANYVLDQEDDGYTIFASTFAPYLANTILSGNAKFTFDDFHFMNIQWFDYDLISVNKDSKISSITELLNEIKNSSKKMKIAVIHKSSGHLTIKLLLEKFNIPFDKVEFEFFVGGKLARNALIESKVDLLVIAAQGSEKYRNDIKPLAVISDKRSRRWDAPTLNEAIENTNISIPIINGPMRGFAVSKKFKEKHPEKYLLLEKAIERILAKRSNRQILKEKNIGYTWIGDKRSKEILDNTYDLFERYNYLFDK